MSPLLRIRELCVGYPDGTRALDGVSLDLTAGERLAVIGESGSGKTTLARAIAGILPREARLAGALDWAGGRALAAGPGQGYVFQSPGASFDPVLSIGCQMTEVLRVHGVAASRAEAREQAAALLAQVGIPEPEAALSAFPHQVSGGQLQRMAIACAIAAGPRLLVADEPTSALDMVVQARVAALLDGLVRARGMTLLFITHDIALAAGLADRIAVFHRARLVQIGPVAEVLARPAPYTGRLIAAHLGLDTPPLVGAGR